VRGEVQPFCHERCALVHRRDVGEADERLLDLELLDRVPERVTRHPQQLDVGAIGDDVGDRGPQP
jgi:hypothetical protein